MFLGPEGQLDATLPRGAPAFGDPVTGPATIPMQEVGSEDIDSIMYTSGTTGLPKGVIHRHARCYGGVVLPIMTGYTEQGVVDNTLSLCHIGAQYMVWMALVSGSTVPLAASSSGRSFWPGVRPHGS